MDHEDTIIDDVQQLEQRTDNFESEFQQVRKTNEIGIQCNILNLTLRSEDVTNLIRSDSELQTWTNIPSYKVLEAIIKCVDIVCSKPKNVSLSIEKLHYISIYKNQNEFTIC